MLCHSGARLMVNVEQLDAMPLGAQFAFVQGDGLLEQVKRSHRLGIMKARDEKAVESALQFPRPAEEGACAAFLLIGRAFHTRCGK